MIVRYLPLTAFTIALISGAFQVQADTPCYLCDNLDNLKNLPEPPGPPKNNACAMLAIYAQRGQSMSEMLKYVEDCNSHPDKLVCEASSEMIRDGKIIDIEKLELTCKG